MLVYKETRVVDVYDWDNFVSTTYNKPYNYQQQEGCKSRGFEYFTVPANYTDDENMHDEIPYEINGRQMGVKFKTWLEATGEEYPDCLFWARNFYPDRNTLINDLYNKGLLEAGTYLLIIDW